MQMRGKHQYPRSLVWLLDEMGSRISQGILTYRVPILCLIGILLLASLLGFFYLRVDFSIDALIQGEDEALAFFERFKERFEESDHDIFVLIQGEDLFEPQGLALISRLDEALLEIDGVGRAITLLNAPYVQGSQDGVRIASLSELLEEGTLPVGSLREKALANSLFRRWLVSEDGNTWAVVLRLTSQAQTEEEQRPVVKAIRTVTREVVGKRYPVYFSGLPVVHETYAATGIREMFRFFLLSGGIICLFLLLSFRSFSGLYIPQAAVLTSVILVLGIMSLCRQELNIVSNIIPTLLMVYGITDAIHLIHRYREELARGLERGEALLVLVRRMGVACFMTSFTTTVGFLSLVSARVHIIRSFGLFAGIGIFIAYLATITVVPILLSFHAVPRRVRRKPREGDLLSSVLSLGADLNERYPRTLIALGLLFFLGSAVLATRVKVESYIFEELAEGHPLVQTNRVLEKELMGIFPCQIQFSAGSEGGVLDPDFLSRVERVQALVASQPWIRKTFSLVDILKEMHQAMNGGDPAFYRLPETRELVAQYLLLYSMSGNQEDLDALVTADGSYLRLAAQGIDMGTKNYFELKRRTEALAGSLFKAPESCDITGRTLLATRTLDYVVHDMLVSFFSAFGIIFLAVWLLYRSLKAALIAMVPNVIPLVFTLAVMAVAGIYLRMSTVIIFAICLGMAVDDTIHYLSRFREELIRTGDYTVAMRQTLATSGRAILLTSTIMISGFLVFISSNFLATRHFGLLSSLALFSSLLGTLIFLPAALNVLRPWQVEPVDDPSSACKKLA